MIFSSFLKTAYAKYVGYCQTIYITIITKYVDGTPTSGHPVTIQYIHPLHHGYICRIWYTHESLNASSWRQALGLPCYLDNDLQHDKIPQNEQWLWSFGMYK